MRKPYSLDYTIQRDIDRVAAIADILDQLQRDPPPADLQLMGSYILYGKDENGLNAAKRGEIMTNNTRYGSYKKKEDKNISLDELLQNPMVDTQGFQNINQRRTYTVPKPTIRRPKYDKKTGQLLDCGDADIPGMTQLWQSIDNLQRLAAIQDGDLAPTQQLSPVTNDYRAYQLKHWIIDLRRHQYYLKDAYKPTLHFMNIAHPRPQFIDWSQHCAYWISREEWQRRIDNALLHTVSKNIDDYETRLNPITKEPEVKWVVRRHTFDWQNPAHIAALINNYDLLYDTMREKFQTYGRTFIFDFQRYRALANLNPVREFILTRKIQHIPYSDILKELKLRFDVDYTQNHLSAILARDIPKQIALAAKKVRLEIDTPDDQKKVCYTCHRKLPRDNAFFSVNNGRKDHWSSNCKDCEKKKRIARGGQTEYDRRRKDTNLFKVPSSKTSN